MATLYWNDNPSVSGGNDGDWSNTINWFTNADCTVAAGGLPTSADSVVILYGSSNGVNANTGPEPTIVNLSTDTALAINVTVTGLATFFGNGYNVATLTGNARFEEDAYNSGMGGIVTGTATFDNTYNQGTVTTGVFQNSSYNQGTVTGNSTFTNYSFNVGNVGDVSSNPPNTATFSGESFNGVTGWVIGNAIFNDSSFQESYMGSSGNVSGNATWTASSFTSYGFGSIFFVGNVGGTVTFSSATPVTFTGNWNINSIDGTIWNFTAGAPTWNLSDTLIYYSTLPSADGAGRSTFTNVYMGPATIYGSVKFIGGGAESGATVTGAVEIDAREYTFTFGSYYGGYYSLGFASLTMRGGNFYMYYVYGSVGTVIFDIAAAQAWLQNAKANYVNLDITSATIIYDKGINGSSILGVV